VWLSPFEWNVKTRCLSRVEKVSNDKLVEVRVAQKDRRAVTLRAVGVHLLDAEMKTLSNRVSRWLSLDWDPGPAVRAAKALAPDIARFIKRGGGRFLKGSSFFEDFVKTLCTVNASWSFTEQMVKRLVNDLGEGAFPTPDKVLEAGVRFLRQAARLGYRSAVLVDTTEALLKRRIMNTAGSANPECATFEALLSLKGIGAYAAAHLSVLLCDFRRIPIDSEVRPYCLQRYGIEANEIDAFFEPWGEFRFLGYKLGRILERTNWIGEPK
jgi:3-methyladenine DNA glycosylase/8-oxoguanine DNA glycosylase